MTFGRDVVFARSVPRSERAQRVRLTFGSSDEISIFLNGTRLFNGNSGYLARDATCLGTLTLGLDAVYFDLARGHMNSSSPSSNHSAASALEA